jgi:outer membrane protein assembly factor BamB
LRWKFPADGAVNSSPAVLEATVYFTSLAGTIYAVSLNDGLLRWKVPTGKPLNPAWAGASGIDYYVSSPAVTDDLVIAGAADGILYALARTDGSVRWRAQTEGRIHSSPAIRQGSVFVGSFDGSVYAFDLETGARRWRFDTEGRSLESEPVGFDRRSIVSSPAVTDSSVYIGSRDGHFYAIDVRTGRPRWRVAHDGGSWSISSPAIDGGMVYDASSDARFVHALSAATGDRTWRSSTAGPVWSSPALTGRTMYVGDGSGAVHALDRATGRIRWSYRTGGAVMSSPAVADGVLFVGSADGSVYALRLDAGPGLARAVYWDSAQALTSRRSDHRLLKEGLVGLGYTPLSAAELPGWLEERIQDRRPSVMILASDQLPGSLASSAGAARRYLESGGKVVSVGDPPFIWPAGPSGERDYAGIRRSTTSQLLDVDHSRAQFDRYGSNPTELGREWGLTGWWLSSWSIDSPRGALVLARDERGLAAAWVKGYGGGRGTGFVQVNRTQWTLPDLGQLITIAEYRPE